MHGGGSRASCREAPLKGESGVTLSSVASKTERRPLWRLVPYRPFPANAAVAVAAP